VITNVLQLLLQIPTTPDALSDEQMDELQEELTVDFDMGYAIKVSRVLTGYVSIGCCLMCGLSPHASTMSDLQCRKMSFLEQWSGSQERLHLSLMMSTMRMRSQKTTCLHLLHLKDVEDL
jgi:hypothetical protein